MSTDYIRSVHADFKNSFRDALAAAIRGTGLASRFLDQRDPGASLPWLEQPGTDGERGYWIGCGLSADPAMPPASWPTHLHAHYLSPADDTPDAETLSTRVLDLTLTGDTARDAVILARITVTAVLRHIDHGCPVRVPAGTGRAR